MTFALHFRVLSDGFLLLLQHLLVASFPPHPFGLFGLPLLILHSLALPLFFLEERVLRRRLLFGLLLTFNR